MLHKLLALLEAMDDVAAAAVAGIGVGLVTAEPGAGVATFGALWFLGARLDRTRLFGRGG